MYKLKKTIFFLFFIIGIHKENRYQLYELHSILIVQLDIVFYRLKININAIN